MAFMIQSLFAIGAKIDAKLQIWQNNEAPISITETPYQHLGPLISEAAARARTRAAADSKTINRNLHEIDKKATLAGTRKMTAEDRAMLRTIQSGGGYGKTDLLEIG